MRLERKAHTRLPENTPVSFNQRIGQSAPIFQMAQDMPKPAYNEVTGEGTDTEFLVEQTATDAAIFLTGSLAAQNTR